MIGEEPPTTTDRFSKGEALGCAHDSTQIRSGSPRSIGWQASVNMAQDQTRSRPFEHEETGRSPPGRTAHPLSIRAESLPPISLALRSCVRQGVANAIEGASNGRRETLHRGN